MLSNIIASYWHAIKKICNQVFVLIFHADREKAQFFHMRSLCWPFSLPCKSFILGLCLHLLYLNRIWSATTHVQLMVTHRQRQDSLVDAHPRSVKHKILLYTHKNHKTSKHQATQSKQTGCHCCLLSAPAVNSTKALPVRLVTTSRHSNYFTHYLVYNWKSSIYIW